MAQQFYQIVANVNNNEDLKRLIPNLNLDNVQLIQMPDDNQQFLIQDESYVINDNKQVQQMVYQQQQQHQPQQQQGQQIQQSMQTHHQHQYVIQDDENVVTSPQQQQQHHQQQHHIQQPHHQQQIYYSTDTNQLVQGSMIQHTQPTTVQAQQQQPQQQVIYQHVQAQHQPQHHQQIILQKTPDGTIRQTTMQTQQVIATPQNQAGHLIVQQSPGNPSEHILVQQSTQQHPITQTQLSHQQIVRPQQRIVYKTQNPIVYQQHSALQQQQQQQQIQTTSPNQQRLMQQRSLNQQQQTPQQNQNIVFHPVQQKPNQTNTITYQQQQQQQQPLNQTLRMSNTNIIRAPSNRIIMNPAQIVRVPSPRAPGIRQQIRNSAPITTLPPNIIQPRAQRPRSLTPRGAGRGRGARNLTPGQVRMTTTATSTVAAPKLTQMRQVTQTISPNQSPQHQQINQIVQQNSAQNIAQKTYTAIIPGQRYVQYTNKLSGQQPVIAQGMQQQQQQQQRQDNNSPVPSGSIPTTRPGRMPSKLMTTNSGVQANQMNQSDDIEDSIQAVFVSKPTDQKPTTSDNNQIQQNINSSGQKFDTTLTAYYADSTDDKKLKKTIALSEYKRTQQKQQNPGCKNFSNLRMVNTQQQGIPVHRVAPMPQQQPSPPKPQLTSNPEHVIQTQQIIQNRIQNPQTISDGVERGNAKMLVILASGEQRLITFTLPRDSCTVQELLEQVNVPFDSSTTIQCVSSQGANIDYVVTVGIPLPPPEARAEWITNAEQSLITSKPTETVSEQTQQQHQPQQQQQQPQQQQQQIQQNNQHVSTPTSTTNDADKLATNDTVPPKLIKGFLAVCQYCGVCGIDHAKCDRCKRVFLEEPKRVPNKANIKNDDKRNAIQNEIMNRVQTKVMSSLASPIRGRGGSFTVSGRGRGGRGGMTRAARQAEAEPVILTLSSDDEGDDEKSVNSSQNSSSMEPGLKIEKPLACEPIISDIDVFQQNENSVRENVADLTNYPDKCFTNLTCKLIRIGTFRFEPKEKVVITAKGIRIIAPSCSNPDDNICLDILEREILKLVVHWVKPLPIIFMYVMPKCGIYIRESLDMKHKTSTNDIPYFNPLERAEPYKRIVLQMDSMTEESRSVIKSIFSSIKLEQINIEDANELLNRASAKDILFKIKEESEQNIRRILIYPQGKGGISINTEDYMCLAIDQYLNDVIIDFYLKYIHLGLPIEQRNKYHIFSSFFYKRLTTMTTRQRQNKDDVKLTAAQKRHARVASWTKNVNLFEKDFIIIPINEQSHWFLAIICFPMLTNPVTYDTLQPVMQQQVVKKKKTVGERKISLQIGNTTITPLSKRELEAVCVGDDESERDEAEGDDSDLASDDSDTESTTSTTNTTVAVSAATPTNTPTTTQQVTTTQKPQSQSIKQPLILIFDSLSSGAARSRVVATLRDYLTCEYRAKIREPYVFNKTNMPGHCVKVPQQNNFTDCGLYVLQYVEQFCNDPIKDYKVPIKQLVNWFETIVVTRKREEISNLLKELVSKQHPERLPLPEIQFPTVDGKLVEPEYTDEQAEFEEEEMEEDFEEEEEDAPSEEQKGKSNGSNSQEIIHKRTIGEIGPCKLNEPPARKLKVDEDTPCE